MKQLKRGAGILLAVSSLPSRYGIGTLGTEAYHFVDLLADLRQTYWQVLPLGPTGLGDSPYQSFSAFAGNPYLIDLEALADEGLLDIDTISEYSWGNETDRIDYAAIFHNRFKVLRSAFDNFNTNSEDFQNFCREHVFWLHDYALFMAIKEVNQYSKWQEYKNGLKYREESYLEIFEVEHERDILFWKFLQYEFYIQWFKLKEYANKRGILIIGEVPLYVSEDSADVWANRELFMADEEGYLTEVAGCPPDAFSKGGQNWGNPLYNWDALEETDYSWWKERIRINTKLYDVIRINHFVGVVKDYCVPAGDEDGTNGKWRKAPGKKLADAICEAAGETTIIAEDFGTVVIPTVRKLMNKLGWAGMKVLLFAFDQDPANRYLPHNYEDSNCVVYGTTHDSDTIVGYFKDKSDYQLAFLYEYLGIHRKEEISDAFIRLAYSSIANVVILQMQDILALGNEARMNHPATVGNNWRWRLWNDAISEEKREWLRTLASIYRR